MVIRPCMISIPGAFGRCFFLFLPLLIEANHFLGRARLGSIRNKYNWNNASKRLFGSYSHSGIPGFPFRLFCSQEQNRRNIFRNIFLFRNIPNERTLKFLFLQEKKIKSSLRRFTTDLDSFTASVFLRQA